MNSRINYQKSICIMVVATALFLTSSAFASIWTNAVSGNWTTGPWSAGVPDATDAIADFSTLDISGNITVHLDAAESAGFLLFGDTNATTPGSWTLDNNGNAANTLTLATSTGLPAITVTNLAAGQSAIITATLTGANGLAKRGPGVLSLSSLTYTGPTAISNGTILITGPNTLPTNTDLILGDNTSSNLSGNLNLGNYSQTVNSITTVGTNNVPSVITVAPGQTFTVQNNAVFGFTQNNTAKSNLVTFTGGGNFVQNPSGANNANALSFQVGAADYSSTSGNPGMDTTVDMSALASAIINLGTNTSGAVNINGIPSTLLTGWNSSVIVGEVYKSNSGSDPCQLILASNTTITANALLIGFDQTSGGTQTLKLGSGSNIFNINTNAVGTPPALAKREGGQMSFNSATGSLKVRALDGASRASFYVGFTGNGSAILTNAQFADLAGHPVDMLLNVLGVGSEKRLGTNFFTFSSGTIDTTGLNLGICNGTPGGGGNFSNSCTFSGGTVTIGANGVTMGVNTAASVPTYTNVTALNISGSTVTVATNISMATQGSATETLLSSINITGGSLTTHGNIYCVASGAGPRVASLTLNNPGALLDLTGHAIGSAPTGTTVAGNYLDAINLLAGTIQNVSQINNGATNLVKNGTGILTIAGTNSYTGSTLVSNGTLVVNGTIGTNAVKVVTGTLAGAGVINGPVTVQTGTTFSPGMLATIGTLAINNSLTLASGTATTMRLSKTAGANDEVVGLTSVTYGGTLTVTDIGSTALALNDTFTLFQAGSYSGSFSLVNLPNNNMPAGLGWDFSRLGIDGTIKVVTVSQPAILAGGLSPQNVECSLGTAVFTVSATGGALHYYWTVNGSLVANNDFATFTTNNVKADGNVYTIAVTVSNVVGTTSSGTTLIVVDTTPPVITITGSTNVTIPVFGSYTELGATAFDACSGSRPVDSTNGTVNPNVDGTYLITYTAHDGNGNSATAVRTVNVIGNVYWTDASFTTALWSVTTNWSGGVVADGPEHLGDFSQVDITNDVTVSLDTARTIGGLVFGDTNVATPGSWTLDNEGNPANILTLGTTNGNLLPTITVQTLGIGKTATISAVLTGTGGMEKAGPGTLVLATDNTYSGGTTISNGTLQIGNGASGTGSILAGNNITNNAALAFDRGDAVTFSDVISGTGSMAILGGLSLTLNNTNTYTGPTLVKNGTLVFGVNEALTTNDALTLGDSGTAGNLDLSSASQILGSLTTTGTNAPVNTITIGGGQTLAVNGNFVAGFSLPTITGADLVTVTGAGSLVVNTNGGLFRVSANDGGGGNEGIQTTLDMSGLASATINLGNATNGSLYIGDIGGDGGLCTSTLLLANNTTITAGNIYIGYGGDVDLQTLKLGGGTNVFNVNSILVGAVNRDYGQMYFNTSTGSLKVRAADGVGRSSIVIAPGSGTGLGGGNQYLDLSGSGHYADMLLSNLTVGNETRSFSGSSYMNSFDFQNGVLDTTGITIGKRTGGAPNTTWENVVNLMGGTVTVGTNGIVMGIMQNGTNSFNSTCSAAVNVSAGTVSVGGNISLLSQQQSISSSTVTGLLYITGGSVTVNGSITCNANPTNNSGMRTGTISMVGVGALLDLTGHVIGGVAPSNIDVLDFEIGTLQNVAEINAGAPLIKNSSGTLILQGVNSYSGGTTISVGTLEAKSDGALGSGNVTVTGGGTLQLDSGTANRYISPSANLVLDGSGSPVNLAFTGAPNHIAGLSFDGGGTFQAPGTWGPPGSGATHIDGTDFVGTGTVLVTVASSVTLTSSVNPSVIGQSVIFTATVTGASGTPTGTVTFKDGTTVLGTSTLNGSGIGAITNATLIAGSHSLTATYSGNNTYSQVTSSVLMQTVNSVPPSILPVFISGGNLDIQIPNTVVGENYVLQSTPTLNSPITWTPVVTNAGTGGTLTNLVPVNATGQQFFRYQIE